MQIYLYFLEWNKKFSNGLTVKAFADMTLSPINISRVILQINYLMKNKINGIFHCSGNRDISYYNYACEYAKQHSFSENLVEMASYRDSKILPPPPSCTSLHI